ncbi:MAG: hypothetical protein QM396_08520 [Euryarchaeota archaeon]|nr:hypothetical protein [Euryarchaeota archaeon]
MIQIDTDSKKTVKKALSSSCGSLSNMVVELKSAQNNYSPLFLGS